MSSSRLLSPLYILSFSLLLKLSLTANPLNHFCSTSGNFSPNGPYAKNLNKLIGYLHSSTPRTGFSNSSVGLGQNHVYGLAQCRGDVNITNCQTCVAEASSEIQKTCPHSKAAIIYYDYCEVKYSNLDFFGKIDTQDWFYLANSQNASNPIQSNNTLTGLFKKLEEEAYVSPKKYASGESEKLYGLVQCTRDLSSHDCRICIDAVVNSVLNAYYGKVGARIVGGSCNVRFEITRFFN